MTWRMAAIVFVAALAAASRVVAQFPGDTLPTDSVRRDTVDQTARFLEAQKEVAVRLPVLPHLGTTTPLPPSTRIVFTRDSLEWLHGQTLGDLLATVPGTYLWRGGWYGRTENLNYRARGATSVEYYLDGLRYLPVGIDSAGVDPALISLNFIDRVEVERLPGGLRVHLFTQRHDRLAPKSEIGVTSGDVDFARYEGQLARRFSSGVGFVLAADYLSSPTVVVRSSTYSNNHVWLQGSYVPSEKFGVQYQIVRSSPNRRPYVVASDFGDDTLTLGYKAARVDAQLRASYRTRSDGLGPAVDFLYGRTGWSGDGIDQTIHRVGGNFSLRGPTISLGGAAFYQSRWTPFDVQGNLGWTPAGPLSATVDVAYQTHDGGRTTRWALGRAGFEPIRGVAFTGMARVGRQVASPANLADTAQTIRDYEAIFGFQRSRLGLEVAYSRTSAFTPVAPAEYLTVPLMGTVPATDWITVALRLAPLRWLTLQSWYSDPRTLAGVEGIPPTHSVTQATVRSKFLRTFRSGAFDLKLQLSLESWGTGVIGRDATNAPIPLHGSTYMRSLVQFRIGTFDLYWDRGNLTGSRFGYVPDFQIPQYGSTFGVRWGFLN
jgi:hypothetical protein